MPPSNVEADRVKGLVRVRLERCADARGAADSGPRRRHAGREEQRRGGDNARGEEGEHDLCLYKRVVKRENTHVAHPALSVCVCVSLVRVVIICPASTHTALVSSPSLTVVHLSTYIILPKPGRPLLCPYLPYLWETKKEITRWVKVGYYTN